MKKLPVLCGFILLLSLVGSTVVGCVGPTEVTGEWSADPVEFTAEWYAEQAHELGEQGRYDEAIEACNKAIELDPNLDMAYIHRASTYERQGKKAEAIADLETLITLTDNPEWIEIARQEIEALQGQ